MTETKMDDRGEVEMYRTDDGKTGLAVRLAGETVWLTQVQMVNLFGRERSVITKHICNVFVEGELKEKGEEGRGVRERGRIVPDSPGRGVQTAQSLL